VSVREHIERTFLTFQGAILINNQFYDDGVSGRVSSSRMAARLRKNLESRRPDKLKVTLMTMLSRVEIEADRIEIYVARGHLAALLAGQSTMKDQGADDHNSDCRCPDPVGTAISLLRSWPNPSDFYICRAHVASVEIIV
jgi:hypothetical protein